MTMDTNDDTPDDRATTTVIDYLLIRDGQSGIVFCNQLGTKVPSIVEKPRNEDNSQAED